MTVDETGAWLDQLYIGVPGAGLRDEDRKKAFELAGLAKELESAFAQLPNRHELLIIDAAAGKGYAGLLAATLAARSGRAAHIVFIERDARRSAATHTAALRLAPTGVRASFHTGNVDDAALWPDRPSLVVALHACGRAADTILERAIQVHAARLVVVPCCTPAVEHPATEALGIPRHASVRRAFLEALVASERTLRLEAAGYRTEVVPFVPPTVTPYNLAWRGRRVGEPGRMRGAAERLTRLASRV